MFFIEKRTRPVSGAELFFGESVAQYLADISDEAYGSESASEGLLLGKLYSDDCGTYCIVSGVTQDLSETSNAVGWFRSSEGGCTITQTDIVELQSIFGYVPAYAVIIDCFKGEMAMYAVKNGVARKTPSVMIENM